MKSPAVILPDAMTGIQNIFKAVHKGGMPQQTLELVHLRTSQINGCSFCVSDGAASARKAGVPDEQLFAVAAWRETPYFSEAERAALALAEAATRIADSTDPVPDEIWDEAARHYNEEQLSALVLWVALTNFFNRVNITIREQAGSASWGG